MVGGIDDESPLVGEEVDLACHRVLDGLVEVVEHQLGSIFGEEQIEMRERIVILVGECLLRVVDGYVAGAAVVRLREP